MLEGINLNNAINQPDTSAGPSRALERLYLALPEHHPMVGKLDSR
jgi:hypothetical protein